MGYGNYAPKWKKHMSKQVIAIAGPAK